MSEEIREGFTRVSEVISRYSGYDEIPEHILNMACERGTRVHEIIEGMMLQFGCPTVPEELKGYLNSFNLWYADKKHVEFIIPDRWYNTDDMLAGKCDCIGVKDGKKTLYDFKTSANYNKVWQLQAGAYSLLAERHGIDLDDIRFIKLDKKGQDPYEFIFEKQESEELFKAAFKLFRYFE